MKVLFAGPSIFGEEIDLHGIELRPPASQGDLATAVLQGANIIGLVDGNFASIASVWHKEILFALQEGVIVYGASSMGALRAAECARFGMIPVGKIANEYLTGVRDNDADVALLQWPQERKWQPITDPLVDIEFTIFKMLKIGCISEKNAKDILSSARSKFYYDRCIEKIVANLSNAKNLCHLYRTHFVSQKRIDAIELIHTLKNCSDVRVPPSNEWGLSSSVIWSRALAQISSKLGSPTAV